MTARAEKKKKYFGLAAPGRTRTAAAPVGKSSSLGRLSGGSLCAGARQFNVTVDEALARRRVRRANTFAKRINPANTTTSDDTTLFFSPLLLSLSYNLFPSPPVVTALASAFVLFCSYVVLILFGLSYHSPLSLSLFLPPLHTVPTEPKPCCREAPSVRLRYVVLPFFILVVCLL